MRNLLASLFVCCFLVACAQYTYTRTEFHPRQSLVQDMPASAWDSYVRYGGSFR